MLIPPAHQDPTSWGSPPGIGRERPDLSVDELLASFSCASVRTEVRELLMSGRRALVIGRNSGEAGVDPAIAAVKSLESALEWLAARGVDYRPLVPDRDELIRLLRAGQSVTSTAEDGSTFKNTFRVIDLHPYPVVLLLSMGSAKKLDMHFTQPFVHFLAQLCADVRPGLLFASRIDRLVRHAWAFGEPMTVLEAVGGYAGDERGLFVHPTGVEALQVFFDATNAQQVADTIPLQSRQGQQRATEPRMVDGRVRYGVGSQPPAGVARVRMRAGTSDGPSELFLEMSGILPDPSTVAYGLPEVFDDDGRHVDQVMNVRWALSVIGKKDWPDVAVARELVRRRFSTTGLRSSRKDTAATWTEDDADSSAILDALYRRLEFYETGRLECQSEKFGPIIVEDVFPLDGPWATEADFRRIRRHQSAGQEKYSNRATRTFAGLHVEVNGVSSRMYLREGTKFRVRSHGLRCTVPGRVSFTHEQLARAIATAIGAAGDAAVQIVPLADDASDPELRALMAKRRPIELELIGREQRLTSLRMRLEETLEDGSAVLTGRLARDVNEEYNKVAEQVDADQKLMADIDESAQRRRDELRSEASRVRVDVLLDMVASLRDPSETKYRDAWRAALHELQLTTVDVVEHHHVGQRFELRGWLGVGDDTADQTFRMPLYATWMTGPAAEVSDRVDAIVEGMRHGVPYGDSKVPGAKWLRALVCERLGDAGRVLAACDDPRILRVAMAVTVDRRGRSVEEIAAVLAEPASLVHRVAERFAGTHVRGRWYDGGSSLHAAVYALAANGNGSVDRDDIVPAHASSWASARRSLRAGEFSDVFDVHGAHVELVARCDCSPDRVPVFAEMVIRETAGPVCRRCWRDRNGVCWPPDQYQGYILEMGDTRPRRRAPRRR